MSIEKAREAKRRRHAVLVDLRNDRMTIEAALRSASPDVLCHSVWAILTSAWQVGPVMAEDICFKARLDNDRRTLAELLPDEKEALIRSLPRRQRSAE